MRHFCFNDFVQVGFTERSLEEFGGFCQWENDFKNGGMGQEL
jgi:hypothetical protein